ncbi:hypothetical protein FQA39_LY11148 [Lamprigera yunnana]|nr:hypothetical protein FQA39_LY11148 [Lamprigera yunnana]
MDDELSNNSYLNVRMCSILAQNGPNEKLTKTQDRECSDNKKSDNLQVYLRIKKSNNSNHVYHIEDKNTLFCKLSENFQYKKNHHPTSELRKAYKFSSIFGPESTQLEIFTDVVQQKIVDFMNGINCTLLTYGASGSGKTYTIVGNANQPGIIPRALESLFRSLPHLSPQPTIKPVQSGGIRKLLKDEGETEKSLKDNLLKDLTDINQHLKVYSCMQEKLCDEPIPFIDEDISHIHLSLWVSFAEIYNEYIYDLLAPAAKRGQTRNKLRLLYNKNNAYIKDLRFINVTTAKEAYCILQYGLQNLNYAETCINDHSSRSHSVFTIRLAQSSDTKDGISVSSFNFCDLAGSERLKKTNNLGDRLKESNNINTSLLVLGRCIAAVRNCQQQSNLNRGMPFRESKFTQLFQNALSGNESIFMIVTINSNKEMVDESQHVLNFSAIAKDVTVVRQELIKRKVITSEPDNCAPGTVEELQTRIIFLYKEIEQQQLDYEQEREFITEQYKKMIAKADKFWENASRNLQIRIAENKQQALDVSDESVDSPNKNRNEKRVSIVVLDSSSDEDDDNTAKQRENNSKAAVLNELLLQKSLLKQNLDSNEIILENIVTKNNSKENLLKEVKYACSTMQSQYQVEIEKLREEVLKREMSVANLSAYKESYVGEKVDWIDKFKFL